MSQRDLPDRLLTSADLGRLLGKTPNALRVQLHRDPETLPVPIRLGRGRHLRWDPRDVDRWLDELKQENGPGSEPEPLSHKSKGVIDNARPPG